MFSFSKKTKEKDLLLIQTLEQMIKRIENLEQTISQTRQGTVVEHVNIEKVTIDKPTLEQLTLRLDNLDIEELSGALNIGNNFGTSVHSKDKKKNSELSIKTKSTNTDTREESLNMKGTSKGYQFHFQTDE